MQYDAFICHASEDKENVARPLAEALIGRGYRIWYDEFALSVGDSLRRSIDRGLRESEFGVVIVSPSFFAKEWPQKELDGLTAREVAGQKVILPVWHEVNHELVAAHSPTLADRVATHTRKGLVTVTDDLAAVLASGAGSAEVQHETAHHVAAPAPTALEFATQLQGQFDAHARREGFLSSVRGVEASDHEFVRLSDEMKRLADEIARVAPAFSFREERRRDSMLLYSSGVTITVAWVRQWANTLNDSELVVRVWDGPLSLGGRLVAKQPSQVLQRLFDFEMTDEGTLGWRETSVGRFQSSDELADDLLRTMMEHIGNARRGG